MPNLTIGRPKKPQNRAERLAAALRENLKRRKAQARAKEAGEGEGMAAEEEFATGPKAAENHR